jgi:hypothetical protein
MKSKNKSANMWSGAFPVVGVTVSTQPNNHMATSANQRGGSRLYRKMFF